LIRTSSLNQANTLLQLAMAIWLGKSNYSNCRLSRAIAKGCVLSLEDASFLVGWALPTTAGQKQYQ